MRATGIFALALLLWFFASPSECGTLAVDGDRDGLADEFEQELLHRFAPRFMVAMADCDVLPSEFLAGSPEPRPLAKNGTIYAQVFPSGPSGALIEIHYYHLWSQDCGRRGHALDVEHVSVLTRADRAQERAASWKAVYWYAAAHQDTICDARNGALASQLHAEEHGPTIWISRGKHASFLSYDLCMRGCGGDRCDRAVPFSPPRLINIGEPGATLNGAIWAESRLWPLAPKMKTNFNASVLAVLDDPGIDGATPLNVSGRPMKRVIAAAGSSAETIASGNRHTVSALSNAGTSTDRALDTGFAAVARSINRARRAVAKGFRMPDFGFRK
jgi:hypothetical protein